MRRRPPRPLNHRTGPTPSGTGIRMRHSLPLLVVLLLAPVAPLRAQTPAGSGARVAAALSADVLRGHLEFLADDALEGRAPGTRGGLLAGQYIAAQFRRLGLEPAGDSG